MASLYPCSSKARARDIVNEVPEHLVPEILGWLPAKCLARCKCVCKEWLVLIQDHYFLVTMHLARSTPEPITLQYTETLDPSSTESPQKVETLDIFSGLLLEQVDPSKKLRLRNPITGKILDLSDPPSCHYVKFHRANGCLYRSPLVCSGFHAPSRQHKLVSFYHKEPNLTKEHCAVLTVGKDRDWREIPLSDSSKRCSNMLSRKNLIQTPSPAAVHFLSCDKERDFTHHIHSFDFESERFHVNSIDIAPNDFFADPSNVQPCCWDDRFGLYEIVGDAARIMVLEDYKRGKWRKEEDVHLKFLKEDKEWGKCPAFILGWPHKMLFGKGGKAFMYNPVAGTIVELPEEWLTEDSEYWPGVSPSLVEFNGMREAFLHEVYQQFSSKRTLE